MGGLIDIKIIGTKEEVETVLSALPGAGINPIPPDGWKTAYQWVPIEIVLDNAGPGWTGEQLKNEID